MTIIMYKRIVLLNIKLFITYYLYITYYTPISYLDFQKQKGPSKLTAPRAFLS